VKDIKLGLSGNRTPGNPIYTLNCDANYR